VVWNAAGIVLYILFAARSAERTRSGAGA